MSQHHTCQHRTGDTPAAPRKVLSSPEATSPSRGMTRPAARLRDTKAMASTRPTAAATAELTKLQTMLAKVPAYVDPAAAPAG